MNAFKIKSLALALTGLGAIGAASVASAQAQPSMSLNPDGMGQALVYPMYSTATSNDGSALNTFVTLVNSTSSAKAMKVRFRDALNSQDLLDFQVYLSAHDVWTGVLTQTADGTGTNLMTQDTSCTVPALTAAGTAFRTDNLTGDGAISTALRTQRGYIEAIEMGTIKGGSTLEAAITHDQSVTPTATPKNCSYVLDATNQGDPNTVNWGPIYNQLKAPQGGVSGEGIVYSLGSGQSYGYNATTVDNFANTASASGGVMYGPQLGNGTLSPNGSSSAPLTQDYPTLGSGTTNVLLPGSATAVAYANGMDAYSATLLVKSVVNEYMLDSGYAGNSTGTDWVVTFPTKWWYINNGSGAAPIQDLSVNAVKWGAAVPTGYAGSTGTRLFQSNFNGNNGSCDTVTPIVYNREEGVKSSGVVFSPSAGTTNSLCFESNVVQFGTKPVLTNGSTSLSNGVTSLAGSFGNYSNGWASLTFNPGVVTNPVTGTQTANYTTHVLADATGTQAGLKFGLPAVGFEAVFSKIGSSVYSATFPHKYTR